MYEKSLVFSAIKTFERELTFVSIFEIFVGAGHFG
jgi:hypothetical protein